MAGSQARQPVWLDAGAVAFLPLFGLVHLAMFLTMLAMMVSLVNTGTRSCSWRLPDDVPLWAGG